MKRVIFYFSATGNTLVAAREFAEKLGDTELVPIASLSGNSYDITGLDVGIAFPVYSGIMPNMVTHFVESLSPSPGQYFFGICTCGGMSFGALGCLARVLAGKGASLSLGTVLVFPSNYIPFGEAPREEKQKVLFEKASAKISETVEMIKSRGCGKIEKSFFPLNLVSRFAGKYFAKRLPLEVKKFTVTEACTGCGLCARICPAGNIEMKENRPVWNQKCELCYGCINWCPCTAIEGGWMTKGKKRYHHPDVRPEDMIISRS